MPPIGGEQTFFFNEQGLLQRLDSVAVGPGALTGFVLWATRVNAPALDRSASSSGAAPVSIPRVQDDPLAEDPKRFAALGDIPGLSPLPPPRSPTLPV
jgi:hypothetical protein